MLFFIIFLICVALVIMIYKNKTSNYWKKQNIIHEYGTIWNFVFGKQALAEVYKDIYDKYPNEPHVGIFLGSKPALLLRDLENVQAVMANDFQNFHGRGIIVNPRDTLADNVLFIDDYDRWRLLRLKLSPVFTSKKLKNMFYILERCARDFTKVIKDIPSKIDLPFNALYTYTSASIAASVFGIDTHVKNTMESPFIDMSWKVVTPSFKTSFLFLTGNLFPKLFQFLDLRPFAEFDDFFIGAVKKVLNSRKNEGHKRHDLIDIFVELQEQGTMKDLTTGYDLEPTDEVLAAQAFFFFLAGSDTSANTMHFTLIELSYNPDVLKRVHEEIDQVFDGCEEKLDFNEIEKIQYLDMVVNEAMRKYPPIGLFQRRCSKSTTLPVGNVKIEEGTLAVIPLFALHRDEKYYPNPELFDPERFSPENASKLPKFGYMPFGEGNRFCLGMRFARLQVKAGLAWLLRRYTLKLQSEIPLKYERSPFSLRVPDISYDFEYRKNKSQ